MKRIWLIGGTRESVEVSAALVAANLSVMVSVTTETARSLYPPAPQLQVWVGQLTPSSLPQFLQQHQIAAVLDASHPFAVAVSQMAIAAAIQHQLPYLRYERAEAESDAGATVRWVPSFEELVGSETLTGQRVLLTIGYRTLPLFQPWQQRATLFARILPSVVALEGAIAAGFTPDRLVALRPPIGADLERSLWQQWQITTVVTKASGAPGGENVKRQVAAELGIPLIVVERPPVTYPRHTDCLAIALEFGKQSLA